jgi:hypothetical protein
MGRKNTEARDFYGVAFLLYLTFRA